MLNLYDLIKDFEKQGIKIYEAELPTDVISKGIGFFELEDFIEYLTDHKLATVFGTEYFAEAEEYLISEELIEKECGFFDYNSCFEIQNEIKKYNNSINKTNFNLPYAILLATIVNGVYLYYFINEEVGLPEPIDKLKEIIVDNELEIKKVTAEKENNIIKLKEELRKRIIKDEAFVLCTNQRLRTTYMHKTLSGLGSRFEPLKSIWLGNFGNISYEASNFIELIWREIKGK